MTTPDRPEPVHPAPPAPASELESFRKATQMALTEMDRWADLAHVLYLALTGRGNWRTAVAQYEEAAYSPEKAAKLAAHRAKMAATNPHVSGSSEGWEPSNSFHVQVSSEIVPEQAPQNQS